MERGRPEQQVPDETLTFSLNTISAGNNSNEHELAMRYTFLGPPRRTENLHCFRQQFASIVCARFGGLSATTTQNLMALIYHSLTLLKGNLTLCRLHFGTSCCDLGVTRILLGILENIRRRCGGGRGLYPVLGVGVTLVKPLGRGEPRREGGSAQEVSAKIPRRKVSRGNLIAHS